MRPSMVSRPKKHTQKTNQLSCTVERLLETVGDGLG